MMGDEPPGSSKGPVRLDQGGAATILAAKALSVIVGRIKRREPFRDNRGTYRWRWHNNSHKSLEKRTFNRGYGKALEDFATLSG
jgi:hypothetical protein